MQAFKFFNNIKRKIDWRQTGLLEDATNFVLLGNVLDRTYEYICNNESTIREPKASMLLIIMTRLFKDKVRVSSFLNDFIDNKLNEVVNFMDSPRMDTYILDIQQNAWSGIDVEAEITQILVTTCNWYEE